MIARFPALFALPTATVLALTLTLSAQDAGKAGAKPAQGSPAKPAQGGAANTQLAAVQALLGDVGKFLKDPKGDAPIGKVITMQRKALEAWQADKKSKDVLAGTLDLELAIEKKDWAEATKAADGITKHLPAGLKPDAAGAQDAAADKSGTLENKMKSIGSALKKIETFLKTPTGEAPLAQALDMQRLALEAKDLDPKKAEAKSGEEKDKFVGGYKKEIRDLVMELCDLQTALDKKDWEAAKKQVELLKKHENTSHKVYKGGNRRGRGGEGGGEGGSGGEDPGKGGDPKGDPKKKGGE